MDSMNWGVKVKILKTLQPKHVCQLLSVLIGTMCVAAPVLAGKVDVIPEPGTMSLVALGAAGVALAAWKRKK